MSSIIVPPELSADEADIYKETASELLSAYRAVHERAFSFLQKQLPLPGGMKAETYRRNLVARAFDVARYLLPFGISTGVGQVTSIRTLEKQIRRLKSSEFQEVREIGEELTKACAAPAECGVNSQDMLAEPVAPTLARHANADEYAPQLRADVKEWAADHLPKPGTRDVQALDLICPTDHVADICATLLYPITDHPYRKLYELACDWPAARRQELLQLVLGKRTNRDELPRHFRSAPYVFDFVMDIGTYRDLHRHRRCQQLRQQYTNRLGYEVPDLVHECAAHESYSRALQRADDALRKLPQPAAQYLLPFASRSRFLFKMDFAELEYISRLRSGVKGHFSYRKIAWEMKQALADVDPMLGALVDATPPCVQEPLKR